MDDPTIANQIQLYFIEDDPSKIEAICDWTRSNLSGFFLNYQIDPLSMNNAGYVADIETWLATFKPECTIPTYLMVDGNIQRDASTLILPSDEDRGNGIRIAYDWLRQFISGLQSMNGIGEEYYARIKQNLRIVFSTTDTGLFSDGASGEPYRIFINLCRELGIQTFTPQAEERTLLEFEVADTIRRDLAAHQQIREGKVMTKLVELG